MFTALELETLRGQIYDAWAFVAGGEDIQCEIITNVEVRRTKRFQRDYVSQMPFKQPLQTSARQQSRVSWMSLVSG